VPLLTAFDPLSVCHNYPLQGLVADTHKESVESYVKAALHKSDRERSETAKDKTGVFTGAWDNE
jgi:leucyl-tRNA synthetase